MDRIDGLLSSKSVLEVVLDRRDDCLDTVGSHWSQQVVQHVLAFDAQIAQEAAMI